MVLARVAVIVPDLASLVVASPRLSRRAVEVARDLAGAAQERGRQVRLLESAGRSDSDSRAAGFSTLQTARATMRSPDALTIVTGGGILDDPDVFTAAAVADGVLLVAQRGRSLREDLTRSRSEIEQAGGTVLGAVLVQ